MHILPKVWRMLIDAILNNLPTFCFIPLAYLLRAIARTGAGTNICLTKGVLPLPVHFYSPIPDIADLEKRGVWKKRSAGAGIDFNLPSQLDLLAQLGQEYGHECAWPRNKTKDQFQFFTHNGSFSYGCAATLHTMIRSFKPRRIYEIGSGNSSLVISSAIDLNSKDTPHNETEYVIIDPYPSWNILNGLPHLSKLLQKKVECVDTSFFQDLTDGDILFVDSGHTVKTGSDVNALILDILPTLQRGVIIHFHDISFPDEYSEIYFKNPKFRVFWTEAYLLQAFLAFNNEFEILLSMSLLMGDHLQHFCNHFREYDPASNWANSGSFWIRRKNTLP